MSYVIHYDVAAVVISAFTMISFLLRKNIMNYRTKVFYAILWGALLSGMMDIVTVLLMVITVPVWVTYAANMIYLLVFSSLSFLYFKYISSMLVRPTWWTRRRRIAIVIPYVVYAALLVTTPLTKWIFYVDADGAYVHGKLFHISYAVAFCYVFATLFYTQRNRRRFTKTQILSVTSYSVGLLASLFLQVSFPKILLLQFAVSVSVWLMYQALENTKNFEKTELGIYNRQGFMKIISCAVEDKEPMKLLGIRFNGFQVVRETLGVENSVAFHKQIVDFLSENLTKLDLCWMADGIYIACAKGNDRDESIENAIRFIHEEFNSAVKYQGMQIVISAAMFVLDYPKDVDKLEDILDMVDYEIEKVGEKEDGVVLRSSEEVLAKLRREHAIAQLMKRALADHKFEVYYQPIYSVAKKKYRSAEALVRLIDEELGFVGPDEFIPIAEKNGTIFELGEYVFRSVCSMLSRERLWEKGIEYIEVNLSPVQCMEADLHEKLFAIMDEYKLPCEYINLEITESATVSSEEILRRNIDPLLANGVTFSLDDYGTGYSNISNVISYPFHIIKIDKSMVWSAMKNDRAMRALRHTIAMIKDLDIHIVAEGVETAEQAQMLGVLGCGFLQGYYYSKPVPEKTFLKLLREAWDVDRLGQEVSK
ncbi:MAG: EAL domain-containing protein [Eubacteriales bacterium]|nr:EAL domain-containing protein [Eubacteriales bacterium]